jgi:LacI family transcriptional regulator
MPAGRPTLADVAARAGVSLKTASRALNGEYGVAAGTSAKVLAAARELGFRPNQLARSLAAGRASAAVGLVISYVSDPFLAAIMGAVEEVLAPRDLHLITASHRDDPHRQRSIVQALVERRVDALLVVPAPGDASYLQREIDHGLQVVALDRPLIGVSVDTVTVDNQAAAAEVVRRFAAAGHRRIGAVTGDQRLWTIQQRMLGYGAGLRAAGLVEDPALVIPGTGPDAVAAITALLQRPDPPTAMFAAQNRPGRQVIRAAGALGRRVELAVFDEIIDPDLLTPPPLVAESGPVRLGTLAAELAMERLDGRTGPPRSIVLPVPIVDSSNGTLVSTAATTAPPAATDTDTDTDTATATHTDTATAAVPR